MTRPAKSQRRSRDRLIAQHRRYVENLAGTLIRVMSLPARLRDDLVAAGYLGLVEAAERFDSSLGMEFKNFAYRRIRGAMIDSIRRSSELSGRGYRKARAFDAAFSLRNELDFKMGLKKEADPAARDHLAEMLNYVADSTLVYRLSLADAEHDGAPDGLQSPSPEDLLDSRQDCEEFGRLLRELPPKERQVLEEYYFRGKSFVEIARQQGGVSKSWVCRLHQRAIQRLRRSYQALIAEGLGPRM